MEDNILDTSFMDIEFDNSPYPELDGIKPNKCYADMLLYDYAGFISESTAIFQYAYQHYVLKNVDSGIAKTLEKIAIQEMRHHEFLAEMILKLGGDPKLMNPRGVYFNGRYVDYTRGVKKMLMVDIDSETKAIECYERDIKIINDEVVTRMLKRIVKDEKVHIRMFESMLAYVTSWD